MTGHLRAQAQVASLGQSGCPGQTSQSALIAAFSSRSSRRQSGSYLFVEGARPRPLVLLEGWVSLQRTLPDGRRQIFNFALPGDIIGIAMALPALFEAVCLTPVAVADASTDVPERGGTDFVLATAMADHEQRTDAITLNHLIRLGRLTSFERVGHFLLEVQYRLGLSGVASEGRFQLPVTQETLGDHLGLSVVHINRTLQSLKRENLIDRDGATIEILNREALAEICHFSVASLTAQER